ncbi:T9SS type A sorting domain-containing protein [uncultured Lutibacter sp.]|uniref:T9SS type A sorting domain-containing protein n=1 Tax=uncultured Lutibacter sp. TaxID=437739 RepID=UPI002622A225|nr:T9SS type A sorting domain-containing protein [uncultured Lutibacter sp.]
MKKLLLITFLCIFSFSFAQQNGEKNTAVIQKEPPTTLSSISAYPNPFNVRTRINFKSSQSQIIEFTVKNLLGKTVYFKKINAKIGYNSIEFERDDLRKGMYIYSLQTDSEIISKRLVIR